MRLICPEILRDCARCPNPWADLRSNKVLPHGFHGLFEACESVLAAARQLLPEAYGAGRGGILFRRAEQAKAPAQREAALRKLFPVSWRADTELRIIAKEAGADALREFDEREERYLKMMAKKKGKAAAENRSAKLTAEPLRRKHTLEYLMMTGWVRCGPLGDPGLCFYSDAALADLFSLFDWRGFNVNPEDLSSERIERMRERLGLRKAHEKIPWITSARINPVSNHIELNTLEAKVAKSEWPKSPLTLRCSVELCGQVLYPGIRP